MNFKSLVVIAMSIVSAQLNGQMVGDFDGHQDIGNPALAGNALYDAASQEYTISGAGYNIWFERDEFHFLHKKIEGDFIVTADFAFEGEGTDPHRKIGWMIRESLDDDGQHISGVNHGDGLVVMQWRKLKGAFMRDPQDEIFAIKSGCQTMQMERVGQTYILRTAHPGEPLQEVGRYTSADMPNEVFAGIYMCSHNPEVVETAKVWNVRIDQPVGPDYDAYEEGFSNSRLETIDPFTARRKVIYSSEVGFEAPNWMPNGDKLLFNQRGGIYTIPITGGTPTQVNTDFAQSNNNDHVISFDGKMLSVSNRKEAENGQSAGSAVYVLPLEGGTPKLVTMETPSYLHGWNPNNEEVVYVANRGNRYDVYKKRIDGKSPEVKLTDNTSWHVDGCEYSPDGKYIYYNGSKSGTMQLWRMKPDGSDKEQLTFDQYNNWFPHVSPDGKWIAFLSFVDEIDPNDHPPLKRVMLRLMPANGGAVKAIAFLYGGQGTINVPSWSPDSKQLAFVSYWGL